jgi:hypothetical protein
VRDTIHGFKVDKLERVLGSHQGILPANLAQFTVLLWLLLIADPTPLITRFRNSTAAA